MTGRTDPDGASDAALNTPTEAADGLAVTSKWLGNDVCVGFRECETDPDHSAIMAEYGLEPGDRPGTDLSPRVSDRSGS